MGLKIDLLCNDGSPIRVIPPDIDNRGVGGAEMAMMSLMKTLAARGHKVRVFNDPRAIRKFDGVDYRPLSEYSDGEARDIIIIFRSPNKRFHGKRMPHGVRKIFWSCDQYTVGSFAKLADQVDYVVTISKYHTDYHHRYYGIPLAKMGHIDLGVRQTDYLAGDVELIEGRCIFCSIPDRGLRVLHAAWPLIVRDAPHASLVVTGDYTLWGGPPNIQPHRLMWADVKSAQLLGAVSRERLVALQRQAEIHAYPSTYEELFCMSVAECQVAGAYPITTTVGALPTTNEFGALVHGDPTSPDFVRRFAERVSSYLTVENEFLRDHRDKMRFAARRRFDWNRIAESWETLFQEGKL